MFFRVADQVAIPTYFRELTRNEIRAYSNESKGWVFDWNKPMTIGYKIFVLTDGSNEYQGLIALRANTDPDYLCVDVEIIESAPWNKKDSNKQRVYIGVGKQLVAFACQYSIDCGLDGCVQLTSKSSTIRFYKSLGAIPYSHLMIFDEKKGQALAKQYFPGGVKWWTK